MDMMEKCVHWFKTVLYLKDLNKFSIISNLRPIGGPNTIKKKKNVT